MNHFLASFGWGRWLALAACAALGVYAYFLRFYFLGFSFSALVCLCLALIILFYTFLPYITAAWPLFGGILGKCVTVCLILGALVFVSTEAVILHASFGSPETDVPYLVVLGAKIRTTGPSASLWDRIYAAADYLNQHPNTTCIVSGGMGDDEPVTEASAMFDQLVALGIDPQRIWVEDQATSTWENLNFSLKLIQEKTGKKPDSLGVLSSEYHLFRASLLTKACGVDFVGIPARTSNVSQMVNHFMREVAGVWHYLLLGASYDA